MHADNVWLLTTKFKCNPGILPEGLGFYIQGEEKLIFKHFFWIATHQKKKIKSSLDSRYYAEARSEWQATSAAHRLENTASRKRRNGGEPLATVCNLTDPEMKPKTSRTVACA